MQHLPMIWETVYHIPKIKPLLPSYWNGFYNHETPKASQFTKMLFKDHVETQESDFQNS